MSFFISDALAQGAAAAPEGPGALGALLPFIILFIVFYFFLIRPQSKRAKEHKNLVQALAKGDEVVTNGGMMGVITDVADDFVAIEIAEGVIIKVQKSFIASMLPKGTMDTA